MLWCVHVYMCMQAVSAQVVSGRRIILWVCMHVCACCLCTGRVSTLEAQLSDVQAALLVVQREGGEKVAALEQVGGLDGPPS